MKTHSRTTPLGQFLEFPRPPNEYDKIATCKSQSASNAFDGVMLGGLATFFASFVRLPMISPSILMIVTFGLLVHASLSVMEENQAKLMAQLHDTRIKLSVVETHCSTTLTAKELIEAYKARLS